MCLIICFHYDKKKFNYFEKEEFLQKTSINDNILNSSLVEAQWIRLGAAKKTLFLFFKLKDI